MKKRVLVIGLDGATFDVIRPMVEAGRLPVIGEFMRSGSWGGLRSTVLPVTPPAWSSFMTGRNPGKHGVFGFYAAGKESYETAMVTGAAIKARKMWEYLDDERVGLVDIPLTYPPEPVNGCMISGWPVPSDDSVFTHPPELHTEIIREIGDYMLDRTLARLPRHSLPEALGNLYRYTDMRKNASLYLLKEKGPFDFFMVVFRGTDFVQHETFKFRDEEYCRVHPEAASKYRDIIFQFYERMDAIIAELVEAMGEDAVTVIMSDHGGGLMKKRFYFNRWLRKEGFLFLKKSLIGSRIGIKKKPFGELLARPGGRYIRTLIPGALAKIGIPHPVLREKQPFERVDWSRTKACSNLIWTDGVVRINIEGREPEGSVAKEDYDRVRDELREKLKGLKDPDTGECIVQDVYNREDIYRGPFVDEAPDLLVLTRETSYVFSPALDDGPVLERPEDPSPAPHRMEGIFIGHGPGIGKEGNLTDLHITDLAPTVLYLMGKPIPRDMDGKILQEAIAADLLQATPPVFREAEPGRGRADSPKELSPEEERMLVERLKDLGYME